MHSQKNEKRDKQLLGRGEIIACDKVGTVHCTV